MSLNIYLYNPAAFVLFSFFFTFFIIERKPKGEWICFVPVCVCVCVCTVRVSVFVGYHIPYIMSHWTHLNESCRKYSLHVSLQLVKVWSQINPRWLLSWSVLQTHKNVYNSKYNNILQIKFCVMVTGSDPHVLSSNIKRK